MALFLSVPHYRAGRRLISRAVFFILAGSFAHPGSSLAQMPDAELVSYNTTIFLNRGRLHKTYEYELRINNPAGEKHSTVSIPFSKLVRLSRIRAHITDGTDNVVRELKKKEIRTRSLISGFSLYEDHFIREFTLRHNTYPYSIHYSYEIRQDEFLFIEHWMPVLDIKIPTLHASLNVDLPAAYQIFSRERLTDGPAVSRSGETSRYTWTASYGDLIESEIYSPPPDEFLPRVVIVPEMFKYELTGSSGDWTAYGDWQAALLEGLLDLPGHEQRQVTSLIDGIDDRRELIKILYNYLQDRTRYINVTIGTGGLKPYPASYVANNKFGDCKALTNYFRAMLDFAGISSNYATIHAGKPAREIDRSFPSQQFNHAILCIPLHNDTIWLDCTSKEPFGYTGTFIQNRDVLVIDKGRSHFARTPSLSPAEVRQDRTVRLAFGRAAETLAADFTTTYRGSGYESLFYISRNPGQARSDQIIRNNFMERGFDAEDYSVEYHRDSTAIKLSYSGTSRQMISRYNNEIFVRMLSFPLPRFEPPSRRKLPVQLDYPVFMADSLEYTFPDGYRLANKPESISFSNSYGEYNLEFIDDDDSIRVVKRFILNPGRYTGTGYAGFFDFVDSVRNIENSLQIRFIRDNISQAGSLKSDQASKFIARDPGRRD
jgi:hypothetical protein